MKNWEWRHWASILALVATAASVSLALAGYWVLAAVASMGAGVGIGAVISMSVVSTRDVKSLKETPKKLAAATTESAVKALRYEIHVATSGAIAAAWLALRMIEATIA